MVFFAASTSDRSTTGLIVGGSISAQALSSGARSRFSLNREDTALADFSDARVTVDVSSEIPLTKPSIEYSPIFANSLEGDAIPSVRLAALSAPRAILLSLFSISCALLLIPCLMPSMISCPMLVRVSQTRLPKWLA